MGSTSLEELNADASHDDGTERGEWSEDICRELPAGEVPEWIQIVPEGKLIQGRDGRTFTNNTPDEIIAAFKENRGPIPLDFEHSSFHKARIGERSDATGWIEQLEIRNQGSIWARVDWTALGAEAVSSRKYRFVSPHFRRDAAGNIQAILTVGLTNIPNFHLSSLNQRDDDRAKDKTMDPKKLAKLLGLPETSTEEEICAAIEARGTTIEELNAKLTAPDPEKFVPRSDFDKVREELNTLSANFKKSEEVNEEELASRMVEDAMKAEKVTPGAKDYWVEICQTKEGRVSFEKFLKTAPVVAPASNLDNATPPEGGESTNIITGEGSRPTKLSAAEESHCQANGLDAAEFLKTGQELWDEAQLRRVS